MNRITGRRFSVSRRPGLSASLVLSFGFALAFVHAAGCSNSGSSSDGSAEGGHGGTGGTGSGGGSGESGHPGSGGAAGAGSGGAASGGASGGSGGVGGKGGGGGAGGASGGTKGGSGGAGGAQTYGCGSGTCTVGQSFCYSYTPGTAGSPSWSCEPTTAACASAPTSCACLCPPATSAALGCIPVGVSQSAFCTCSDAGGIVNVSCAGS